MGTSEGSALTLGQMIDAYMGAQAQQVAQLAQMVVGLTQQMNDGQIGQANTSAEMLNQKTDALREELETKIALVEEQMNLGFQSMAAVVGGIEAEVNEIQTGPYHEVDDSPLLELADPVEDPSEATTSPETPSDELPESPGVLVPQGYVVAPRGPVAPSGVVPDLTVFNHFFNDEKWAKAMEGGETPFLRSVESGYYPHALADARWLRYIADLHLGGTEVAADTRYDAETMVEEWFSLRPASSLSEQPAETMMSLSALAWAAADLGITTVNFGEWKNTVADWLVMEMLAPNTSQYVMGLNLLAAISAADHDWTLVRAGKTGRQLVEELTQEFIKTNFTDGNLNESERDRSIHHQLIDMGL